MTNYFETLPLIRYSGVQVRDISRRDKFKEISLANPYLFLPYTIKEGDRAEDIAYYYYGSVEYTWLVHMSNNIIDPYTQWPLSEDDFHRYLIQKYKTQSGLEGYDVVDWTRRQDNDDNIVYYYKEII
jgi:hypothetical protein